MPGQPEPSPFDGFVHRCYARLLAYCEWLTAKTSVEALDLLHDTLLALAPHVGTAGLTEDTQLLAYARKIAFRLLAAYVKADVSARAAVDDDALLGVPDDPAHTVPERVVVGVDAVARVRAELSERQWEALCLVATDHSEKEIAARLGLPSPNAASALVYRARRSARKAWEGLQAGVAALVVKARRVEADFSAPTALVGAVVVSMVAGLAPSAPTEAEALTPQTAPPAPGTSSGQLVRGEADDLAAGASGPARDTSRERPSTRPGSPAPEPGHLPIVPVPVPSARACVPTPADSCDERLPGDTVTILGGPQVNQDAVPVCDHFPTTPVAECTRKEPARWIVKEVPPSSTGGTVR